MSFDNESGGWQDDRMNSLNVWASGLKRRLERAGFKVRLSNPALAGDRKRAGRLRDVRLMAQGKLSPDEIQCSNSVFGGRAKRFRIVDYGGLNDRK